MTTISPLEMNGVPDMASTYLKYGHGGNFEGVVPQERVPGMCIPVTCIGRLKSVMGEVAP